MPARVYELYELYAGVKIKPPLFQIGQVVQHRLFYYRGVIVAVDENFKLPPEWYDRLARKNARADQPWYQVLVHDASHISYVPETNLDLDISGKGIQHPLLDQYFISFKEGRFI